MLNQIKSNPFFATPRMHLQKYSIGGIHKPCIVGTNMIGVTTELCPFIGSAFAFCSFKYWNNAHYTNFLNKIHCNYIFWN